MNGVFKLLLVFLSILLPVFFFSGCGFDREGSAISPELTGGDDDSDDDDAEGDDGNDDADDDADDDTGEICDWGTYDPLIVEGKRLLSSFDPEGGYDAFVEALVVCPDIADAKLGMLLADVQWYGNAAGKWFHDLYEFILGQPDPGTNWDGAEVQAFIREQLLPLNAEMVSLAA